VKAQVISSDSEEMRRGPGRPPKDAVSRERIAEELGRRASLHAGPGVETVPRAAGACGRDGPGWCRMIRLHPCSARVGVTLTERGRRGGARRPRPVPYRTSPHLSRQPLVAQRQEGNRGLPGWENSRLRVKGHPVGTLPDGSRSPADLAGPFSGVWMIARGISVAHPSSVPTCPQCSADLK